MERKATSLTLVYLLFFGLLVLSVVQIPLIRAYDYGYGHASIIYTSQWNQTDDELMRAEWACNDIYNLFASRGYWEIVGWYWDEIYQTWLPIYEWKYVYGHVENYHAGIYEWRVQTLVQHCEQDHPTTAIFYHGHGGKVNITNNIYGPYRYFIYEQAPQQGYYPPPWHPKTVDDWQDIYPYTANNHRFVFLWACAQGDEVGGYVSGYHRGMPYAWSHRSSLSQDGYASPDTGNYVFIGFENMSRRLSYWPTANNSYKYWLVFFYYFALNGYSIKDALDEASKLVWGPNRPFYTTELYNGYWERNPQFDPNKPPSYPLNWEWWWSKMRVYGNGARTLPH